MQSSLEAVRMLSVSLFSLSFVLFFITIYERCLVLSVWMTWSMWTPALWRPLPVCCRQTATEIIC